MVIAEHGDLERGDHENGREGGQSSAHRGKPHCGAGTERDKDKEQRGGDSL